MWRSNLHWQHTNLEAQTTSRLNLLLTKIIEDCVSIQIVTDLYLHLLLIVVYHLMGICCLLPSSELGHFTDWHKTFWNSIEWFIHHGSWLCVIGFCPTKWVTILIVNLSWTFWLTESLMINDIRLRRNYNIRDRKLSFTSSMP